jgi:hypothetical protein
MRDAGAVEKMGEVGVDGREEAERVEDLVRFSRENTCNQK